MWTDSDVPAHGSPHAFDQQDDEEPGRRPHIAEPSAEIHQGSSATRHLCAGVYLDPAFRDLVLRKIHNDTRHRVAPSAGFDLVCVVRHAWRARVLQDVTYASLLAVLALALVTSVPAGLTALCLIGLWYLVPRTVRLAPGVLRHLLSAAGDELTHRRDRRGDRAALREQSLWLALAAGGCVFLGTVAVLIAEWQSVPLTALAVPAALWVVLAGGLAGGAAALRQRALNRVKRADSLRPAVLGKRLTVIDQQQSHTFVVYRRPEKADLDEPLPYFLQPEAPDMFRGSGDLLMPPVPAVIQLMSSGPGPMAEREGNYRPFCTADLVGYLAVALAGIAEGRASERLPCLEVRHRVFVAETDIASRRECLQLPTYGPGLEAIINDPTHPAQHFLEMRVSTKDELVVTVYARMTMEGRSLILSVAAFALARTPAEYHVIDRHAASGKTAVLWSALRGLRDLPAEVGRSWRLLQAAVLYPGAAWAIRPDPTHVPRRRGDIAARFSVREEKSAPWENAAADQARLNGHLKILEKRLLAATREFLTEHDVDTSGFSASTAVIINAQVVTLGGQTNIRGSEFNNYGQPSPNRPGGSSEPRGEAE